MVYFSPNNRNYNLLKIHMVSFTKLLYTLGPVLLFLTIVIRVLSFLGIGIDAYAIYLGWIVAATIFYIVLPSKQSILDF